MNETSRDLIIKKFDNSMKQLIGTSTGVAEGGHFVMNDKPYQ